MLGLAETPVSSGAHGGAMIGDGVRRRRNNGSVRVEDEEEDRLDSNGGGSGGGMRGGGRSRGGGGVRRKQGSHDPSRISALHYILLHLGSH